MPQIFSPQADSTLRLAVALGLLALVAALVLAWSLARSDRAWGVRQPLAQPIPFSHALHAGGLGMDCRYCHSTVERAASAGLPTAELCLGCHEQVWAGAAVLAPLRSSIELDIPIAWRSLHRLPDHARFHHAVHVQNGVGCETCHGAVWAMPQTVKVEPMSMGWCLDCHRNPEPALRPREAVFDRGWAGAAPGGLAEHVGLTAGSITDCYTCHR
jgi:hypothetical protein